MNDPTISELALPGLLENQSPIKVIEFKEGIQNARLKSAPLPSYFVKTVNMNGKSSGKGSADDRRMLILTNIRNFSASVIFCQELPGCFKEKVVDVIGADVYDFVANGSEAAVMWRKNDFDGEPVDTTATSSTRIKERLDKRSDIDTSEVLRRTAIVKLQSRGEASKYTPLLAVSWHGPYKMKQELKIKAFNGLTCFLQEVCKEKNVSCFIIGGDFNLSTENLEDEDFNSVNVTLPTYVLSPRSKERQRDCPGYISYKDNFAFFTIPGSNNRSLFGDIRVYSVRPFEFADAEDPSSDIPKKDQQEVDRRKAPNRERKDLLDHDPIVGVLELLTIVKQTEMQLHEGQEDSLSGSFKQLSIGSNPADDDDNSIAPQLHHLHGNVYSWVYDFCQSNIDGRDSSNACSIISMAVSHHFLATDIQLPSNEDLSSDWSDLFLSCMRKGNEVYDSTTHPHLFLTAEEAAELYLDPSSSNAFMEVLESFNPVKLEDEHVESTLIHRLESLTQTASNNASRCAALFIYDNKTISFLFSPDGSIMVIDSHIHPNHDPSGAAIMFAESFTPDFVSSLKEIANMNDSTFGSFSRVSLNDVN